MIESDPIPAGENNFIKICLDESTYRLRFTDLFGNILFELEKDELFKFNSEFNFKLLTIQELMAIDKKRESVLHAAKSKQLASNPVESTINTNNVIFTDSGTISQSNSINSTVPAPVDKIRRSLELVPIYPPLNPTELAICIRAMIERQKLSEKVTIDDDENLEQFILQVFTGEQITVNKIINRCAGHSISLLVESLGRTLERLVQEGKITSSKAKIKENGHEYNLYAINYIPDKSKSIFDSLLAKLDTEFTTETYIELAKQYNVQEETAMHLLEKYNANGEILFLGNDSYKKLD